MNYAHLAIQEYSNHSVIVAIFWDRESADHFAESENDLAQCEFTLIESIALVDMYGFPCRLSDLPTIAPWSIQI